MSEEKAKLLARLGVHESLYKVQEAGNNQHAVLAALRVDSEATVWRSVKQAWRNGGWRGKRLILVGVSDRQNVHEVPSEVQLMAFGPGGAFEQGPTPADATRAVKPNHTTADSPEEYWRLVAEAASLCTRGDVIALYNTVYYAPANVRALFNVLSDNGVMILATVTQTPAPFAEAVVGEPAAFYPDVPSSIANGHRLFESVATRNDDGLWVFKTLGNPHSYCHGDTPAECHPIGRSTAGVVASRWVREGGADGFAANAVNYETSKGWVTVPLSTPFIAPNVEKTASNLAGLLRGYYGNAGGILAELRPQCVQIFSIDELAKSVAQRICSSESFVDELHEGLAGIGSRHYHVRRVRSRLVTLIWLVIGLFAGLLGVPLPPLESKTASETMMVTAILVRSVLLGAARFFARDGVSTYQLVGHLTQIILLLCTSCLWHRSRFGELVTKWRKLKITLWMLTAIAISYSLVTGAIIPMESVDRVTYSFDTSNFKHLQDYLAQFRVEMDIPQFDSCHGLVGCHASSVKNVFWLVKETQVKGVRPASLFTWWQYDNWAAIWYYVRGWLRILDYLWARIQLFMVVARTLAFPGLFVPQWLWAFASVWMVWGIGHVQFWYVRRRWLHPRLGQWLLILASSLNRIICPSWLFVRGFYPRRPWQRWCFFRIPIMIGWFLHLCLIAGNFWVFGTFSITEYETSELIILPKFRHSWMAFLPTLLLTLLCFVPKVVILVQRPTSLMPRYQPRAQGGKFEYRTGHHDRVITTTAVNAGLQTNANGNPVIGGNAMLRADNGHSVPFPPMFIYGQNSTGLALVKRTLVDAPVPDLDTSVEFRDFAAPLIQHAQTEMVVGAGAQGNVVEFLKEHATKFSGDKRSNYAAASDFLEHVETPALTDGNLTFWTKWLNGTTMTAFTKLELSSFKAIPGFNIAATCGTWGASCMMAVWSILDKLPFKPRAVCFPKFTSRDQIATFAGLAAAHPFIKKALKFLWDKSIVPSPAVPLDVLADDVESRLPHLPTLPVDYGTLTQEMMDTYRKLGHNPEKSPNTHVLGSTFCSKMLMLARSTVSHENVLCFTIPFDRLVARATGLAGNHGNQSVNVMLMKVQALMELCQGSLLALNFLRPILELVKRCENKAKRPYKPPVDDFSHSMNADSYEPIGKEWEVPFWSAVLGVDGMQLFDEVDRFGIWLSTQDTTPSIDPAFGVSESLPLIVVPASNFPLLHAMLQPGGFKRPDTEEESELDVLLDAVKQSHKGEIPTRLASLYAAWADATGGEVDCATAEPDPEVLAYELNELIAQAILSVPANQRDLAHVFILGSAMHLEAADALARDERLEAYVYALGKAASEAIRTAVGGEAGLDGAQWYYNADGVKGATRLIDTDDEQIWMDYLKTLCDDELVLFVDLRNGALSSTQRLTAVSLNHDGCSAIIRAVWAGAEMMVCGDAEVRDVVSIEDVDTLQVGKPALVVPSATQSHQSRKKPSTFAFLYNPNAHHVVALQVVPRWNTKYLVWSRVIADAERQRSEFRLSTAPKDVQARYTNRVSIVIVEHESNRRQALCDLATTAGRSDLNGLYAIEIDAASCDGSHQDDNFWLQRQWVDLACDAFPWLDRNAILRVLDEPLTVDGEGATRAWLADVKAKLAVLYSGLPWTTIDNGLRFVFVSARALARVTKTASAVEVLRSNLGVCLSTGDDLLLLVRAAPVRRQ